MEKDWHVIKKIIEKQLLIGNCILRKSTELQSVLLRKETCDIIYRENKILYYYSRYYYTAYLISRVYQLIRYSIILKPVVHTYIIRIYMTHSHLSASVLYRCLMSRQFARVWLWQRHSADPVYYVTCQPVYSMRILLVGKGHSLVNYRGIFGECYIIWVRNSRRWWHNALLISV